MPSRPRASRGPWFSDNAHYIKIIIIFLTILLGNEILSYLVASPKTMSSLVFMSIGIHRNAMATEGGGGLGDIRKQEAELRCISKIYRNLWVRLHVQARYCCLTQRNLRRNIILQLTPRILPSMHTDPVLAIPPLGRLLNQVTVKSGRTSYYILIFIILI